MKTVNVKTFRVGWDIGANGWICEPRPYEVWDAFPRLAWDTFGVDVRREHEYAVTLHDGKPHTMRCAATGTEWKAEQ